MADKPARTGVDAIPETGIDTTFDTLTNEEIDTYQRAFDLLNARFPARSG